MRLGLLGPVALALVITLVYAKVTEPRRPRRPSPSPPIVIPPSGGATAQSHAAFGRYPSWLTYAERERAQLAAQGDSDEVRALMAPTASAGQAAASPRPQPSAERTLRAVKLYRYHLTRTKPPVPAGSEALDRHYTAAVTREATVTAAYLQALQRGDAPTMERIRSTELPAIEQELARAREELERLYRARGRQPSVRIAESGQSSLLGRLIAGTQPGSQP